MPNPIRTKAIIQSVIPHGSGTYSLKMKPAGLVPRHKPGQFLHLAIDAFDPTGGFWPESRVFSIASAPGASELEIVYSVKGRYTKRMEECLETGTEVWLKLPYGDFVIDSAIKPGQDVVLIAGGTGISPYLPYFENRLVMSGESKGMAQLHYGIRHNSQFLAHDLLTKCASEKAADIWLYVENEAPALEVPSSITVREGRLDISEIAASAHELSNPLFFLSGPPGMIRAFKESLLAKDISPANIKIDEWE